MLSLLLAAAAQLGGPEQPDFVVVLLDDVGRDKVAAYGDSPVPPLTPNMDRLASQGVLFRNAWAMPTCSPTRAALLTGRTSERNGVLNVMRGSDGVFVPMSRDQPTIPRSLVGYTSVALGKWHLSDGADVALHARALGFDHMSGWSGSNDFLSWVENVNGVRTPRTGYFPLSIAAHTLRSIETVDGPKFIYYCPKLAHSPFHTPPAHLHSQPQPANSIFGQHRQMVESFDTIFGRLLDRIDLDTTYVFLIGDNGSPGPTVQSPFSTFKVKSTMYEGGLRVPFIVAGPGVTEGVECEALVHVTDLFATFMELASLPMPNDGAEDSISFAHLLGAPCAPHERSTLYAHTRPFAGSTANNPDHRAIRTDRYKLIDVVGAPGLELYDLWSDPLELQNLLAGAPTPDIEQIRDRLYALFPVFP